MYMLPKQATSVEKQLDIKANIPGKIRALITNVTVPSTMIYSMFFAQCCKANPGLRHYICAALHQVQYLTHLLS